MRRRPDDSKHSTALYCIDVSCWGESTEEMAASSNTPGSDELGAYGALLRRRWRIVAVGVIVGLTLPALYILFGPKTYTATTSVLVTATGAENPTALANGSTTNAEINLDTEAQIAESIVVARRAQQRIGTEIVAEKLLEDHVKVEVPPNSAVLAISYDARTPAAAQRGAQAFAKAYLANRREQARSELQQHTKALRRKVRTLTDELERVTDQLAALAPGTSGHNYAQTQQDLLTERISTLSAQVGALSTTTVTPGRVISAAQRPTSPSSPSIPLYLAGGLLLGALLGFGAAVLRDRADTRIRHASDVERLAHLPVLMEVPGKPYQSHPSLLPPRSRAGQAFHGLTHSMGAALGHGNHVVLVTGATTGAGTSTVAANVAATLARTGSPTVLVCADLQSVTSIRMLGLEPSPGLSDILMHGTSVASVEQRPHEPSRLRVIAPGLDTEVASEQLQTQAMERFVGRLRQSATYIVVESPSTSTSADAQALADLADLAILVIEMPRTEREQVREGVRRLDGVGAAILGAVVMPTLGDPIATRHQPPVGPDIDQVPTQSPQTAPMRAVQVPGKHEQEPAAPEHQSESPERPPETPSFHSEAPRQAPEKPRSQPPETRARRVAGTGGTASGQDAEPILLRDADRLSGSVEIQHSTGSSAAGHGPGLSEPSEPPRYRWPPAQHADSGSEGETGPNDDRPRPNDDGADMSAPKAGDSGSKEDTSRSNDTARGPIRPRNPGTTRTPGSTRTPDSTRRP